MKTLVYSIDKTVNLFIGPSNHIDFVISGRVYKKNRKILWFKLTPSFSYTLNIPYIMSPFYDGEYATNRVLRAYGQMMEQQLVDKIQELKKAEFGNESKDF